MEFSEYLFLVAGYEDERSAVHTQSNTPSLLYLVRVPPTSIIGNVNRKVVLIGAVNGRKIRVAHVKKIGSQLAPCKLQDVCDDECKSQTN